MNSPAMILLSDAYGKKSSDYGGFVLCPLYGRKSKAFQAASGTTNAAIVMHLVWMSSLTVSLYFHAGIYLYYLGILCEVAFSLHSPHLWNSKLLYCCWIISCSKTFFSIKKL